MDFLGLKHFLTSSFIFLNICSTAQSLIIPADAKKHVGENVKISGIIFGGHYFQNYNQKPTVLILGDTFPHAPLTLIIPGVNKNNFPDSVIQYYFNKTVIVNGTIELFNDEAQVKIIDSSQIVVTRDSSTAETSTISVESVHPNPIVNIDTYDGCPSIGLTTNLRLEELNKLKNRYNLPLSNNINSTITISSLLKKGNDVSRWSTNDAAEITAYVFEIKAGGIETCNCKASDDAHLDTHIVLVADPKNTTGSKRMIVEITPRMRFLMAKQGVDWSTATLKSKYQGHWVKVKGWMFFDDEHKAQSENTNPGNLKNWRATAWEIHPIIDIQSINMN